ncbi:MAG: hypothetical protein K2X74_01005 [Acetobacteraceae bacterium]|nr:hypothetical protein [Acetobacteraceae bacterium]
MADMLVLTNGATAANGTRYVSVENPADVWTFVEPAPAGAAPPGAVPYRVLASLGDVKTPAPVLYTVELDIAEADLPEIFRWYEEEHLPMLTSCPGCLGGTRYQRLDGGSPNLLAAYRFAREGINETPAWITARSTPWTERVRPLFRSSRRFIRRLA